MTWKERRRRASFRGVKFYVDDVSTEQARRTVVHKFPGRATPRVQDLGRDATTFTVRAYVIGDDYDRQLVELEKALLSPGPAKLVHPYRGEQIVQVTGPVRTTERKREAGMASVQFTCTVVDPEQTRIKAVRMDFTTALGEAADEVRTRSEADFSADFDVSDLPAGLKDSAVGALDTAAQAMRDAHGNVTSTLGVVNDVSADIDEFAAATQALISTPEQLASDVTGLVQSVVQSARTTVAVARRQVGAVLGALDTLGGFASGFNPIPTFTPSRSQESQNRDAIVRLFRTAAVAEVARVTTEIPFESFDSAQRTRDRIGDEIDELLPDQDDSTYTSLQQLRTATVNHLDQVARSLPELATFTPSQEMSALLIAHELYGDARRADEIIERNDLRNPGLVTPGVTLEVLSE
jgi:prophage DNA circulation protein